VAIILDEPDGPQYRETLLVADLAVMSAATLVELNVVMSRRLGEHGRRVAAELVRDLNVSIHPFSEAQAQIAAEAYNRFPVLNFGDCFSYALAKDLDIPLLYKGDDFGQTELRAA
jgi:ribonuclease VapC